MLNQKSNDTVKPYVSIIVASYNYARYITQTLDSLINQTYTNFEIIIIDDGSTDNSVEIIKAFEQKDSRIKLLQHKNNSNKGLSESVKFALDHSRGEWIAFCESDDYWAPDHLEAKTQCINNYKDADIIVNLPKIFGIQEIVDTFNKGFSTLFQKLRKLKKPEKMYFKLLSTWDFPTFSVVMVRADALRTCNFCPPIRNGLDVWLWRQLNLNYKTMFVDKELTFWRRTQGESRIWENQPPMNTKMYFKMLNNTIKFTPIQKIMHKIVRMSNKLKIKIKKLR